MVFNAEHLKENDIGLVEGLWWIFGLTLLLPIELIVNFISYIDKYKL